MKEYIGKRIKEIRLKKGIPAKQMYHNLLSRSMYYKFENGKCDISQHLYRELCRRLNVTLDEIENLYDQADNYTYMFHLLTKYFKQRESTKLEQIQLFFFEKYQEEKNIRYDHYALICQVLLTYMRENRLDRLAAQKIKDYLNSIDTWMEYEYQLFKTCLYAYEVEELWQMNAYISSVMRRLHHDHLDEYIVLFLTIFSICFSRREYQYLQYYIHFLSQQSFEQPIQASMLARTLKKFYTALYHYSRGQKDKKKELLYILDFFHYSEMQEIYDIHCALFRIIETKYYPERSIKVS